MNERNSAVRNSAPNLVKTAIGVCVLALGAATASLPASAQRGGPAPATQSAGAGQAQTLSIRDVYDLLEKQGYRNFTEIELTNRGRDYEVKADNSDQRYVKLYVDAVSGRILEERSKQDKQDRRRRR